MNEVVKVEILVAPDTALALQDGRRAAAVGRIVDRIMHPTGSDDPLRSVLKETRAAARACGLTDADVDEELAAWRTERR